MTTAIVQADDFSGAAEVAHQFSDCGLATRILLTTTRPSASTPVAGDCDVVVFDTHSRGMSPEAAAATVRDAVSHAAADNPSLVFKKTDSLWRGNIAAELSALAGLGYHVVLAGAFPAMERTVVDGNPLASGLALRASGLWHAEPTAPPEDLAELFPVDGGVRFVALDDVRSADLKVRLASALSGGVPTIVVVDGETDSDLAAVVDAVAALGFAAAGRPVALAGTGQLAGIFARRLAGGSAHNTQSLGRAAEPSAVRHGGRGVLAVVGSASPAARRQVEGLAAVGFDVVRVGPDPEGPRAEGPRPADLRAALGQGRPVALAVAETPVDISRSAAIVARLALLAQEIEQGLRPDLILTGGETAREVLDVLGVTSLVPRIAVQHGAVVSAADDGRLVATKPGSFGDEHVLAQLYQAIRSHTSTPRAGLPAR